MCICVYTYLLVHSLGVCVRVCACVVARERLGHRHWAVWCGRPFFPRAPWRMASSHVAGVPCTPRALQAVQTAVPRSDVCSQLAAPCSGWELTASEVRSCGLVFWKVARPVCPAGAASQPWTLVAVAAAVWGGGRCGVGREGPVRGGPALGRPKGPSSSGAAGRLGAAAPVCSVKVVGVRRPGLTTLALLCPGEPTAHLSLLTGWAVAMSREQLTPQTGPLLTQSLLQASCGALCGA